LYEKKELKKDLEDGLRSLPEDARTVFILKELEGLSYEEIARILNIQKGTVSSRLFYARQKLRNILFGQGDK
jgi:RNA polymerase sigma-70 factor (ECF subfamily)